MFSFRLVYFSFVLLSSFPDRQNRVVFVATALISTPTSEENLILRYKILDSHI